MREVNMQPLQIRYMTMEQSLNNQSGNNLTQKLFQKVRSAPNVRLKMHPSSSICCLPLIWFRVTGGLRLFWVERWGTPCTGDQAIAELTQTDNCSHSYVKRTHIDREETIKLHIEKPQPVSGLCATTLCCNTFFFFFTFQQRLNISEKC